MLQELSAAAQLAHEFFVSSAAAFASAAHVITGEISCGAQKHFHLETQVRPLPDPPSPQPR